MSTTSGFTPKVNLPLKGIGINSPEIRITRYPEETFSGRICNLILDRKPNSDTRLTDQAFYIIKDEKELIINYLNLNNAHSNLKIMLRAFAELKKYPEAQEELFNFIFNHLKIYQGKNNYTKEILLLLDSLLANTQSQVIKDRIQSMVSENALELRSDGSNGSALPIFRSGQFLLHRDALNSMKSIEAMVYEMLSSKSDLMYDPKMLFGTPYLAFKNLVLDYNFILGTSNLDSLPDQKRKLATAILETAKELISEYPYLPNQLWNSRQGLNFLHVNSKETAKLLNDLVISFLDEARDVFDSRIFRSLALLVKVDPNVWYKLPDLMRGPLQSQEFSLDIPVLQPEDHIPFTKSPKYSVARDNTPRNPGTLNTSPEEAMLNMLASNPELQAQVLRGLAEQQRAQGQFADQVDQVYPPAQAETKISEKPQTEAGDPSKANKTQVLTAESKPLVIAKDLPAPLVIRPLPEEVSKPVGAPAPKTMITPPKCIACS